MKMFQYGCRYLKTIVSNPQTLARINGLFNTSKDARKMFRLLKSIHEVDKILSLLGDLQADLPQKTLEVLSRSFFFVYWILDNLVILSQIKFIRYETKPIAKASSTAWFFGILLGLISQVRQLVVLYTDMAKCSDSTKLKNLEIKKSNLTMNLVKSLGDIMPAANGSEIAKKVLGRQFPEGMAAIGGFVSATLSVYAAWPN